MATKPGTFKHGSAWVRQSDRTVAAEWLRSKGIEIIFVMDFTAMGGCYALTMQKGYDDRLSAEDRAEFVLRFL